MLFAKANGEWFDFPFLEMTGKSGDFLTLPAKNELIPLPEGASLTMMPGSPPYGFDKEEGSFLLLEYNPYRKKNEPVYAMAALLPQGFSRSLLPGASFSAEEIPLLGYTAVGMEKGRLMAAAIQTDEHKRWHPRHYNTANLAALIEERRREFSGNSIIKQLAYCALNYGCFTAQNIFYRRWEGGIPVSPRCNAECLGCISLQASQRCPAPQSRVSAPPAAEEIAPVAIAHLQAGRDNIISFGQGCEGEPCLEWRIIAAAVKEIRRENARGIINVNTNGGSPQALEALFDAGLNSLRVSLFSPFEKDYRAYHRPRGFGIAEVRQSLLLAGERNIPAALNLLAFPGYTDRPDFLKALAAMCAETGVRQIQIRNLNINPYVMKAFLPSGGGMGLKAMLAYLKTELPHIAIGNYTRA
jgi:pyruvate-formate lyase-activating enzyme